MPATNRISRQVVTGGIILPVGVTPGTSDEDVVTWSLTPKWELSEDAMLYARIATGYQPGGPNVALLGVPPTVDSSELTSYEIGMKSGFADDRLQLDLAVFFIDWEDIQIVGRRWRDVLADQWRHRRKPGHRVVDDLQRDRKLRGSASMRPIPTRQLTSDVPSLGGLDGDRLPYVPELTFSAIADYVLPGSATLGVAGFGGLAALLDDRVTRTRERTRRV